MKYLIITFFLSGILIVSSCSSDSEDCLPGAIEYPNQQDPIDGTAYKQSSLDCRLPKLQTFQVNNIVGAEIKSSQNTVVFIGQNTFSQLDGTAIDDEITLVVLEMYRPGEIIACQLSTNGLNDTRTVEPLLSESIFYINAEYNGNPVLINGEIQIFVPSQNKNLALSIFNSPSCSALECEVLWETVPQSTVFEEAYEDAAGNILLGYRSYITDLGWYSFARYNPSKEPRGILYNKALPRYTLKNSKVFLHYESTSVGIAMFSEYNEDNAVFSEKYREIPENTSGNIIFVSKPENSFNFGANQIITSDGQITITRNLKTGSEIDLILYINNL